MLLLYRLLVAYLLSKRVCDSFRRGGDFVGDSVACFCMYAAVAVISLDSLG
jgi:hypothetical protein